jgi:hypothetical protein
MLFQFIVFFGILCGCNNTIFSILNGIAQLLGWKRWLIKNIKCETLYMAHFYNVGSVEFTSEVHGYLNREYTNH